MKKTIAAPESPNASMMCGLLLTLLGPSSSVAEVRSGKTSKEEDVKAIEPQIRKVLKDEGGAAGLDAIVKAVDADEAEVKAILDDMVDVGLHKNGDYILDDSAEVDIEKNNGTSNVKTMEEKWDKERKKESQRIETQKVEAIL